jgi:hypothetical protein
MMMLKLITFEGRQNYTKKTRHMPVKLGYLGYFISRVIPYFSNTEYIIFTTQIREIVKNGENAR